LNIPRHVAIIMDGNGRWAERRGQSRYVGHRRGVEAVRNAIRAAGNSGVRYLTLFAFSSENWSRPKQEVDDLMGLLRIFIRRDLAELHQNNIRIKVIGDRESLSRDVLALLTEAEDLTKSNTSLDLIIAFNYGGRDDITRAVRRLADQVRRNLLKPDEISEAAIAASLDTAGIPDPDLIIRTSGEQRLSNFLLWQSAYSEFVFLPCLWPDFEETHFDEAIRIYQCRDRRFGGVTADAALAGN
jgi:undecaprenyl diphosphate synthase